MNHGPFQYAHFEQDYFWFPASIGLVLLSFGCIALVIVAILLLVDDKKDPKRFKNFGLGMLGFVVLTSLTVWGWAWLGGHTGEIEKKNYAIATQNIQTKYDVKSVEWHDSETDTYITHTGDENFKEPRDRNHLVIQAQNGKKYVFKYKVNLETGEPTLEDMPIPGGSKPDEVISAASLEK